MDKKYIILENGFEFNDTFYSLDGFEFNNPIDTYPRGAIVVMYGEKYRVYQETVDSDIVVEGINYEMPSL